MIWLLVLLAVVAGLASLALAALYAGDPEGRGAGIVVANGLLGILLLGGGVLGAISYGLWRLLR